jgi:hypothetical protein
MVASIVACSGGAVRTPVLLLLMFSGGWWTDFALAGRSRVLRSHGAAQTQPTSYLNWIGRGRPVGLLLASSCDGGISQPTGKLWIRVALVSHVLFVLPVPSS